MLLGRRGSTAPLEFEEEIRRAKERKPAAFVYAFFWSGDARTRSDLQALRGGDEGWRATSPGDARTRKGEIWVEDARMREPFVIGFSRGKWVETRQILAEAMAAATRRFVWKPWFQLAAAHCALSPPLVPLLQFSIVNEIPVFEMGKKIWISFFSSSKTESLSLSLWFCQFNSTYLYFNVDVTNCRDLLLSIIIHRIPLKGGRSILLPFEGPSKQEWIDYYARRRVHNSMYASTLNRPIKWRKSSLLTLALMSSTLSKIRCYILAQSMIVDDRF